MRVFKKMIAPEPSGSATCYRPSMDEAGCRPLDLVHEDADLLIVNKPAGLVCHPTKQGEWSSLIGRVRLHLGEQARDHDTAGRLVNRLDRETSGLVVIARSPMVARELGGLFTTRAVEKRYLAIVEGAVPSSLHMTGAIGPDTESPVAIKACVRDDGAPAETDAEVLERGEVDGEPFTLLLVTPHTGRKHQIRIHLAHAGFPIVGDKLYGADEQRYLRFVEGRGTDDDRRALRLPHHALHALSIEWRWRDQAWRFEAPWPDRFSGLFPFIAYSSSSARSSS